MSPQLLAGPGASWRCDLPASASGEAWTEGKTSGTVTVSPKQRSPVWRAVPTLACKGRILDTSTCQHLTLNLRNEHLPPTRVRLGRNGRPAPSGNFQGLSKCQATGQVLTSPAHSGRSRT